MAKKMHPNSLANLIPIQQQPNSNQGRPKKLVNVIKDMPKDAQERVYAILWTAISMTNVKEASHYISKEADNLPECGFALQIAIRALQGKDGFRALMDILDRLFGRPKQAEPTQIDITTGGKTFTGFSSVLPSMPNIKEICAKIDAQREQNIDDE